MSNAAAEEKKPSNRSKKNLHETIEVVRSKINPAPYNPRTIHAAARVKLRRSMEKFGVVEPLVWNRRTGVLVGGHQRLSILDEDNGYPETDYMVWVSVVDLPEAKERALNAMLNNQEAQGEFDPKMLLEMSKFPDFDWQDAGFDNLYVESLKVEFDEPSIFGDNPNDPALSDAAIVERLAAQGKQNADPAAPGFTTRTEPITEEELNGIKDRKLKYRQNERDLKDNGAAVRQLVFGDEEEADAFMDAVGLPADDVMIDGHTFASLLGYDLDQLVKQARKPDA